MAGIEKFINSFAALFPGSVQLLPWEITADLAKLIHRKIEELDHNFVVKNGIAIHKSAQIEDRVILKAPCIIDENCFIGANAYLRNGVYLGKGSSVGPSCEVKTSMIFHETEIAHLNFIGDSIIGSHVNFEAGSIAANYFNERTDKSIFVLIDGRRINSNVKKFGSLVGDGSKIGANAVLSPGTVLNPGTVVARLELVDQNPERS